MARLTQKDIDIILELYKKIGTYSGVAKETGRSAATVKKYVVAAQEKQLCKNAPEKIPYQGPFFEIEDLKCFPISEHLMQLTEEEKKYGSF